MIFNIERYHCNPETTLEVDYFCDDGVLQHKDYPSDELKYFCEQNDLLNWDLKDDEFATPSYGTISFERYCKEFLCEKDIKLFMKAKCTHEPNYQNKKV